MIGWFVSLFLTLLIALGAATLGALDAQLGAELTRRLGAPAQARVHVEGDPVLQWPRGHVPSASAHVTGMVVEGLPLRALDVTIRDVHFDPLAAAFGRRLVLRGPAPARVAVEVAPEALQARLDALTAALDDGSVARVELGAGRLKLQGRVPRLFALPVSLETGLALDAEGGLHFAAPAVSLNGARMPAFLAGPGLAEAEARINGMLPALMPAGWRLTSIDLRPDGLVLTAEGDAGALPGASAPSEVAPATPAESPAPEGPPAQAPPGAPAPAGTLTPAP